MFQYPQYGDDGEEILSDQNLWRDNRPQQIVGADCFTPFADISNDVNKFVLELTGLEFREMLSALYVGAEIAYPSKYLQIIINFLKMVHCPIEMEDEGGCINFKPYASFITYEPQNPFNEPDLIPDGYINQPFHYNSDFAYPALLGFQSTDVLVPLDAIPVFGDWGDVLGLQFPTIKIHVTGEGQIEVDFLAITAGGQCIVKVGSPPNILDIIDGIIETGVKIIDLGQDITAIPPESDIVIAEEIPIDAPEGTDVYFVFVPKLDVSTEFFGMGGGIRQIGLCGLETDGTTMGIEDIRWALQEPPDEFGYSYYKVQKRVAGVWEDIEGSVDTGGWMRDGFHLGSDAWGMIYALRNLEDFDSWWNGDFQGWNPSPIKAYIDAAAGGEFDPSALEAAIAAAQADADSAAAAAAAAQSDADAANSSIVTINSQIDVLDSRLDALEGASFWHQEFDFTSGLGDWAHTEGDWATGTGISSTGASQAITLADSGFRDGRILYARFQLTSASPAHYTVQTPNGIPSGGLLQSGSNVHYHKMPNVDADNDLEFRFEMDGSVTLGIQSVTLYGVGSNPYS
jgi:hypothetical protein